MKSTLFRVLAVGPIVTWCAVTLAQPADQWVREGKRHLQALKSQEMNDGRAKNVILFIGDGMGVSTVTAARILYGQRQGQPGEESSLSFETFPYTAMAKTYNTNQQTPDSAGTMTAMVTGVKTKAGVLSIDDSILRGEHEGAATHSLTTILERAERRGLSTGVVTTTRLTHATPAACYAHSPERDWESDADLPPAARDASFPDIARQLIEFPIGNGLEVALGGGRSNFMPRSAPDLEYPGESGRRADGRNLIVEWTNRENGVYVWNRDQFEKADPTRISHLLGLFERSHMQYEHDRPGDPGGEPSLSEMTAKAIALLSRNEKGYFLMVEGGRIDHAHHAANAFRALTETMSFADAVRIAVDNTRREDTLIIVTADHSHVFTMAGYGRRGNPILGLAFGNDDHGRPRNVPLLDALGLPYTILGYANGPGYTGASRQPEGTKRFPHLEPAWTGSASRRPDLTSVDTTDPAFMQECTLPLPSETHGGEDVVVYARGPKAHLVRGVMEQSVIYYIMMEALGWSDE